MEANMKMSTPYRVLGVLVSCLFIAGVLSPLFTDDNLVVDARVFGAIFVLLIAPVCFLGQIPRKVLDQLPNSVVSIIKGS